MRSTKPHTYVLDTTVLIEVPDAFYRLFGHIIIPTAVIKELDGLKRGDGNTARAAREVARTLDRLGSYEDYSSESLSNGVRLSTGGILVVYPYCDPIDDLSSDADNRIVGAAIRLKREGAQDVLLLTTDINMRTIARAHRIPASFYPFEMPSAPYSREPIEDYLSQVVSAVVTSASSDGQQRNERPRNNSNVFVRLRQWLMSAIAAQHR